MGGKNCTEGRRRHRGSVFFFFVSQRVKTRVIGTQHGGEKRETTGGINNYKERGGGENKGRKQERGEHTNYI